MSHVLPAQNRLVSSLEFAETISRGTRVGRPTLVVHARKCDKVTSRSRDVVTKNEPDSGLCDKVDPGFDSTACNKVIPTHVGFVVSKAVGGAVVRNRVKRRLRALSRDLVTPSIATGYSIVVRALPAAARQSNRLSNDLAGAWASAIKRCGVQ